MTDKDHHYHRSGGRDGVQKRSLYIFLFSLVATILALELYSGIFAPGPGSGGGPEGLQMPEAHSAARMQAAVDVADMDSSSSGSSSKLSPPSQEKVSLVTPRQSQNTPVEEMPKPVRSPPAVAEEKHVLAPPASQKDPPPPPPAVAAAKLASNRETRCLAQDWVLKHKRLQDDMLAGKRPKRFLVVRPDCGYCGMCNRLNAIMGTYLLAVLTDRAFVIDWRYPSKHGWQDDTNYLDPRLVDWTSQSAVGKDTFEWPDDKTLLLRGWNDDDTIREMLKLPEVFPNTFNVEENEAIILVWMGISPTESLQLNPAAKTLAVAKGLMKEDTVWDDDWDQHFKGCALRALFQPSPTLRSSYCHLVGDGPSKGIGIHVRTGDDRTWNEEFANPTDEHYRFARCAEGMRQAMLQNYTKEGFAAMAEAAVASGGRRLDLEQWHVASDYEKVIEDIRGRFSARMTSMEEMEEAKGNPRAHSANSVDQQFPIGPLLDAIQLSSTLAVIGTCRSTFSAAGGYFGMIPNELLLLKRTNFEMRYFHSTNCPEMPKEDEAEGMCRELVASNRALVEDVLRTPPFVTCPAASARGGGGEGGEKEKGKGKTEGK